MGIIFVILFLVVLAILVTKVFKKAGEYCQYYVEENNYCLLQKQECPGVQDCKLKEDLEKIRKEEEKEDNAR